MQACVPQNVHKWTYSLEGNMWVSEWVLYLSLEQLDRTTEFQENPCLYVLFLHNHYQWLPCPQKYPSWTMYYMITLKMSFLENVTVPLSWMYITMRPNACAIWSPPHSRPVVRSSLISRLSIYCRILENKECITLGNTHIPPLDFLCWQSLVQGSFCI